MFNCLKWAVRKLSLRYPWRTLRIWSCPPNGEIPQNKGGSKATDWEEFSPNTLKLQFKYMLVLQYLRAECVPLSDRSRRLAETFWIGYGLALKMAYCYTSLNGLRSVEVVLRFLLRSTSTRIHYSCYTSVTCLRSVEVLLRFLLRSTSTHIHYSCYTSVTGLRSVEVLLRFC